MSGMTRHQRCQRRDQVRAALQDSERHAHLVDLVGEDAARYIEGQRRQRRAEGWADVIEDDNESQPSDFGLTPDELRAEIRRCQAAGWQPWEIRARFVRVPV